MEEHHEHKHHKKGVKMKKTDMLKSVVAILAILLIASILTKGFSGFGGGATIPADVAAEKAVTYINNNVLAEGTTATIEGVEEEANLYKVKLNIGGQEFDSYLTKDGSLLFPSSIEIDAAVATSDAPATTPPAPTGVEKSDVPSVELFIMSHCPYGTQAEKGIIPIAELLGDKIDFEIKFVNYAMHPTQGEVQEQLRQYCIKTEKEDKFLEYMKCFLADGESDKCLAEVGINEADLKECEEATDEKYDVIGNLEDKASWLNGRYPKFLIDDADNIKYGVRGSPTLVINGKSISSARSPAAYLSTICAHFNEEPEECGKEVSTATLSPGFGYTETDVATAATCG